jgi:hypothetical protein
VDVSGFIIEIFWLLLPSVTSNLESRSSLAMASLNATETIASIDNQDFYNKNLGPFCAGLAFQMFMMGVLTLQTWTYFEIMSSHDSVKNNTLVAAMFLLGAFQTGTDFQLMYNAFVTGYGRIEDWNKASSALL